MNWTIWRNDLPSSLCLAQEMRRLFLGNITVLLARLDRRKRLQDRRFRFFRIPSREPIDIAVKAFSLFIAAHFLTQKGLDCWLLPRYNHDTSEREKRSPEGFAFRGALGYDHIADHKHDSNTRKQRSGKFQKGWITGTNDTIWSRKNQKKVSIRLWVPEAAGSNSFA